jgi:hypothetical protein
MVAVSLLMVIGGIGLLSAIAGFVRMVERRRPDPAWKPRTPIQKFTGYDQDKAVAAKQRALELEHSKRKLADMRARPRSEDQAGGGPRLVRLEKKRRTR